MLKKNYVAVRAASLLPGAPAPARRDRDSGTSRVPGKVAIARKSRDVTASRETRHAHSHGDVTADRKERNRRTGAHGRRCASLQGSDRQMRVDSKMSCCGHPDDVAGKTVSFLALQHKVDRNIYASP